MKRLLAMLVCALILAGPAMASVVVFDDFTSTDGWSHEFMRTSTGAETQQEVIVENGLLDVFGGVRTTTLTCAPQTYDFGGGNLYTNNGGFSAKIESGQAMGINGMLVSDGDTFNGAGSISLGYQFGQMDFAGGSFTARLMTDHVDYIKDTVVSLTLSDGTTSETVVYDFGDGALPFFFFDVTFDMSDFVSVNLGGITALDFTYESDIANDLAIDSLIGNNVTVIPEPMTIAFLAVGGFGILRRRS